MAQVYSSALRVRYNAPFLSSANLFRLLSYLIVIIVAFYLAYNSGGLWRKQGTYREQPRIVFRHEAIIMLDTVDPGTSQPGTKFWSTFPALNDACNKNEYAPASVRVQETDADRDGIIDLLKLDMQIPTDNGLKVHAVTAVIFVQFSLSEQIDFMMNAPIIIRYESPVAGQYLQLSGEIEYRQSRPIYRSFSNAEYEIGPVIPDPMNSYSNFDVTNWLTSYTSRNDTLVFNSDRFQLWRKGSASVFRLQVSSRIPSQTIRYYPGFSELIKFAWIQFASIAVLLYLLVVEFMGGYLYSEQILQTNVRKDGQSPQDLYRF